MNEITFTLGGSALGVVLVAAGGHGVTDIALGDDCETLVRDLRARHPRAACREDDAHLRSTLAHILQHIERPARRADIRLDPQGTDFQKRVWRALRDIASGATASYGEIARRIGSPTAARAVARACASNPLALVIPCHRVVRGDGTLSGYRWGTARKRALLAREKAA